MSLLGAAIGAIGSIVDNKANKKQADRQYDLARNSIKYRVEDAKNAGIHPLYALGAPTIQSATSTSSVGQGMADAYNQYEQHQRQKDNDALVRRQAEANIAKTQAETDHVMLQSKASKLAMAKAMMTGAGKPRSEISKYFKVWNNITKKYEMWPNTKLLGADLPEAFTAALWAKAQTVGYDRDWETCSSHHSFCHC